MLMVFMRSDSTPVRKHLFGKTAVKSSLTNQQRPLNEPNSSLVQAPATAIDEKLMNCSVDVPHLSGVKQRYALGEIFQYMKRYVRFTRKQGLERKSMTKVPQNLLSGAFKTIDTTQQYGHEDCVEPLEVSVPASGTPATVNASDFMFGVSTIYQRFMDPTTTPINECIFWLTDSHGRSNGGKLLLMLLDANDEELQEVANLLGDVGINVDVYQSDSAVEMAVRYLTLVPTLYSHPDAHKKWLATCDDTFFPNMHGMLKKLSSFDHEREMYIKGFAW